MRSPSLTDKLCKWSALLPLNTELLICALQSLATFHGGVLTLDTLDAYIRRTRRDERRAICRRTNVAVRCPGAA